MKIPGILLLFGLAWLTLSPSAGAVQPNEDDLLVLQRLSEDDWTRLRAGDLVLLDERTEFTDKSVSFSNLRMMVMIPNPPEEVWPAIYDLSDFGEYMPFIDKSILVKKEELRPGVTRETWRLGFDFLFLSNSYQAIHDNDPQRGHIDWWLDPDATNDLKTWEGSWQLLPLDKGKHTLVFIDGDLESKFPVPRAMENFLFEIQIKDILRNVRSRVLSGHTWKKGDSRPEIPKEIAAE